MKKIPLLQGKGLLIELPEGATDYHVCNADGHESFSCFFIRTHTVDLHPGNWRIIGMLSEVTEGQASQIARHRKHNTIRDGKLAERLMFYNHTTNIYGQATALESVDSAILAEGYTFQSTPKPENKDFYWGYLDDLAKWETAQSRVLDRSRCLLLAKND